MSSAPYVLLPPSESKEAGGDFRVVTGPFDTVLGAPRERVRTALASMIDLGSAQDLSRVLKVRGPLLERAILATRLLGSGEAPTLAAWQRYNGVVWSHVDALSLSEDQRRRILIPSGLYGLSTGTDLIAEYRLTMKVSLLDVGNVAAFWRPHLTRALRHVGEATIVNLLPKEHENAFEGDELTSKRIVKVSFVRHGGEGVAGHDAKAVKGVLARRILTEGVDVVDGFRWKGWRGRIRAGQLIVVAPQ